MIHCLVPVTRARGRVVAGAHRARVAAGAGLGQREGRELVALGQRRDQPLDLLGRAVGEHRQRPGARVHRDRHPHAGVGARELLEHEHVGEEVGARAAVLDGHAHAHQPQLAQMAEDLQREAMLAIPLRRLGRDLLVGEAPRQLAHLALLVVQLVVAHRRLTAQRGARARRRGHAQRADELQPPSQRLEAHHVPALLARHARQLGYRG